MEKSEFVEVFGLKLLMMEDLEFSVTFFFIYYFQKKVLQSRFIMNGRVKHFQRDLCYKRFYPLICFIFQRIILCFMYHDKMNDINKTPLLY